MPEYAYIGGELDRFAGARRWKAYWGSAIAPYVKGEVLEVGAGIGSNVALLSGLAGGRLVCLEPDAELLSRLREQLNQQHIKVQAAIRGDLRSLPVGPGFDTIVYIDVLEHIEDDRGELAMASAQLRPGGRIIVLAPAHQWLFSPFDAAIGHFRRYDRRVLRGLRPPGLLLERVFYLDSAGLVLSLANRLLLRQSMPTQTQLRFWDQWIVPLSRAIDPLLGRLVGKSILGIWKRIDTQE